MSDTTTKGKAKPAAGSFTPETPKFDSARSEAPKFEAPSFEVPAPFRELAEKSITQAKDNWEKVKAATEQATDLLGESYSTASKGAADYGLKLIEISRANANAAFDFANQLMTVKSVSEIVELSTAHARKQFDAATVQTKELTALAQKVATDSAEPLKSGVTKVFSKAA